MDFWYELEKRIEATKKDNAHKKAKEIFEDMEHNPDIFDKILYPVDQPFWSEAEKNAADRARGLNTDESS